MKSISLFTRRELLCHGLGIVGVGAGLRNFLWKSALAGNQHGGNGRILVVLQLSGGHDGLSAVVPYRNQHYQAARQTTCVGEQEVLKVDGDFGLHPNLKGCRGLLEQGKFAVLHGVGYPNPNRSHFKSMDIWHLGDSTARRYLDGWIGRYADQAYHGDANPMLTLAIGGERPLAIQGAEHPGLAVRQPDSFRYVAQSELGMSYSRLDRKSTRLNSSHL